MNNLNGDTETLITSSKNDHASKDLLQISEHHPLTNVKDDNIPLIEMENINPNKPPLAESESDQELEDHAIKGSHPEGDDSFIIEDRFGEIPDPTAKPPDVPNGPQPDAIDGSIKSPTHGPHLPEFYNRFPYAPGFGPYDPETGILIPTDLESIPDLNVYQHKKTLAQGMMDLALFSANANQLRYVLESSSRHPYFYPGIVLITISLLLQVNNNYFILS